MSQPITDLGNRHIGVSGADGERLTTVPSGVMTCTRGSVRRCPAARVQSPDAPVGFEVRRHVADARGGVLSIPDSMDRYSTAASIAPATVRATKTTVAATRAERADMPSSTAVATH